MDGKDIKFKAEVEDKFKQLGVRDQFMNNFLVPSRTENPTALLTAVEALNQRPGWNAFISFAFNWNETPEGHQFWSEVSNHIFSS